MELDTEADDDDAEEEDPSRGDEDEAEPEGGSAEPLADDDDAEEEDPSEDEEGDDRHAEEAPVETVPVDVPLEIVPVEAPAEPAPTEAPAGDEVIWTDIEMDPRSVVPESPPISPIALGSPAAPGSPIVGIFSDDELEWGTPPVTPPGSFIFGEDSEPNTPSPPPPPPVPMITVLEHDIIVAHHTAELAVAYARRDELRMQLAAERQERLQAQRRQRWRDFRVHRALGVVRRIERRALVRLHSVRLHQGRRHFREVAARVIARAMRRVRRAIRGG